MAKHPNLNPQDRAVFACPYCKSDNIRGKGFIFLSTGVKKRRYKCFNSDCGKWSAGSIVKKELRIK
jgi:hypothetical protein